MLRGLGKTLVVILQLLLTLGPAVLIGPGFMIWCCKQDGGGGFLFLMMMIAPFLALLAFCAGMQMAKELDSIYRALDREPETESQYDEPHRHNPYCAYYGCDIQVVDPETHQHSAGCVWFAKGGCGIDRRWKTIPSTPYSPSYELCQGWFDPHGQLLWELFPRHSRYQLCGEGLELLRKNPREDTPESQAADLSQRAE